MGTPELELAGGGLPANLTEERRLDVEGRIKACDIEGLPSLAGISSRNALSLLTKSKEEDSRIRERRVLKTGDARRLKRDLLEIFAGEASSKLAKNSLLLLTPSLDMKVIRNRLKLRSEEHTSELQSRQYLVCRLLLEKKKKKDK